MQGGNPSELVIPIESALQLPLQRPQHLIDHLVEVVLQLPAPVALRDGARRAERAGCRSPLGLRRGLHDRLPVG